MLEALRPGDTVVIWRLDRLGRSTLHLHQLAEGFATKGIGLVSLREAIDTATITGKMLFGILASLASYERDLLRERTKAGVAAARKAGILIGRRPSLSPAQRAHAAELAAEGRSNTEIGRILGVSRETVRRHLGARL